MYTTLAFAITLGGLLSLRSTAFDPGFEKIEQNTRTVEWLSVQRVTIGQSSSRKIRLTGPWMDFVSSATTSNGVSARNIVRDFPFRKVTMILDASASTTRGDMLLTLRISCPVVPLDCKSTVRLPVRVFETGPIATIQPWGVVPANSLVTFDLTGQALAVAKLLPRLLRLGNPTILQRTSTTMRVRGTTPSCGSVDVALTDENDGDEFPYRHAATMQRVIAGTECAGGPAPLSLKYTQCTPPQVWNDALKACVTP